MESTEKQILKIDVDDAVLLCCIFYQYETFNRNLSDFLKNEKNKIGTIDKLEKVIAGQCFLASRKFKKFYQDNKSVIDKINIYSSLHSFLSRNYVFDDDMVLFKNGKLYEYMYKNREKLDTIIELFGKIKNLGFKVLEFSEDMDFSCEEYSFGVDSTYFKRVIYLDNLEAIPSYHDGVVKYKSIGSNYKMIIDYSFQSATPERIILNDLTFNPDRLPDSISEKEITSKIVESKSRVEHESAAIRNSADLSISVENMLRAFSNASQTINGLCVVDKKAKLIDLLTDIKENLVLMQEISASYDQSLIENHPSITASKLSEEKKLRRKKEETFL